MESDCSVLIVGAAILLVPDPENLGDYDDVINSVLFAQLVANKQIERDSSVDWYDTYTQVLDNFWPRFLKTREDEYPRSDREESVATLSVTAMANMEAGLGRLTAVAMSRLVNVPESSPAINLLSRQMHKSGDSLAERPSGAGSDVHMLVIVAKTPDSLSSVYISFQHPPGLKPHPLAPFSRETDLPGVITLRCAQAKLSEGLYRLAREGVAMKIKDRIAANVIVVTEAVEAGIIDPARETQP